MEIKDWVIMLVPIAINGICLFIFQQIVKRRFSRMEKATEYRQGVLKEFLGMLKEFYEKFWTIRNSDNAGACGDSDFSDSWNATRRYIQDILMYYSTHRMALISMNAVFEKCIDQYQVLIDTLQQGAILYEEGYQLTEKCRAEFSEEYWKMDALIKDFLKQCEQQILQYK